MIGKKKKYKLGDFDYVLPKKSISQYPEKKRDYSKLMVVHRETGEIEHKKFIDIIDHMRKNDLLILNNTKVFQLDYLLQKIVQMQEWKFSC